uniref:Uncharacterized protein n=1 Tax=Chrysotila carterae TaxID=13221 RepID=A0A7S4BC22_CHRCT
MAGMKKQAELAALMQKAKLQKQGLAEDEIEAVVDVPKPPTKSKPKPLQQKRRAPTREELFAMVRKTAKQGSEPSKRAAVPMPRTRPAEPDRGLPLRRPGPPPFGSSPAEGYNDLKQALSGASGPSFDVSDEVLPAGRLLPMPASLSLLPCEPFGVASLGALAGDAPTLVLIASNEAMMSNKLRETLMSFAGRFNAKELDAAVAGVSRVPPSGVRKLARKGGVSYPLVSDEGRAWLGSLRVPASGAPCAFVVEVATGRVVASFGTENAQPLLDRVTAKLRKMKQGPEEPSARQDALTELRPNDTTEAATATSAATNAATNAATDAATDAAARSAVAVGSPAAASPSQQLSAIEAENQRLRAELEAARAASEAAAAAAAEAERMAAARAERIRLEKEIEEEKARAARAQAEAEAAMRAGAEERARKEAAKAKAAAETKAKEQAKARAEFKAREDAKVEKLRQAAAKKEAEAARETERKSKRAQKAAAKVEAKVEAKAEAKAEVSVEERVEERAEESDVADDVGGDRMSSTREAAAAEAAAAATATPQPSETFSATVSADGSTAASESADAFSLRSGSLLPPLPLSALRSLGNGVAPTTLAQLGAGADRVLVLAGLPDSAGSLLKALRTAERTLGRTAAALNVRVTGLCVGGGPAMLSMPLKQAAAKKWISFPLFDDPNGAVLGSLGVKQPQIGAVYALLLGDIPTDADADVEAYSSAGDGADDVDAQGTLLAAFGARDALKLCDTALSILKSAPPPVTAASVAADAATATAATTSATTVPAPAPSPPPPPPALSVQTTFAADETLERSWSELLGDRGARGRGRNEWRERREGGRGALRRDAQDEAPRAILRRDDTTSFPATKYKYVFLPKLRTVMKLLNQTEERSLPRAL